ncbi:efflux RND transporter periplasmic adaptor subunit [Phenylobacterium sp. LjRoot225]|uniref:efflux RND transporter periplasmic adaptor subunit n=1 Tax=Phenylobacterium sp. LjRoot225 TaxID=3342285 RepID=UPI003ECDEF33
MRLARPRSAAPLIFLTLAACGSGKAASPPAPPLVRTLVVGQADSAPIRYTGVVRARIESDLGFRVGGKIVERLVDPGQRVRRGQPLLRLDATDLRLEAAAAVDGLRAAQAEATRADAEEARLRRLVEAGAVSRSAYDVALAAARSAGANLSAARAGAGQAANQQGYATLLADADGVVTEVLAQPGQVVSAGAKVVRLARAGDREAAVAVPETQVATLPRVGRAFPYGSETPLPARLREVAGAADPLTRTYDARFALADPDLPLGATVTVELPRLTASRLAVPLSALHDGGAGSGVWVVRSGRVTFRRVQVAALGEETASIAAGALAPGDRVVALGAQLLREGETVRLADAGSPRR